MGVFGFGNVGGAVADETTAGFVTDELRFLYKGEEDKGDRLHDATGNLNPILLSTGVAMDCAAGDCTVDDTTLLAEVMGGGASAGVAVVPFEIWTPATGSGDQKLLSANSGQVPCIGAYLSEASSKWRIYVTAYTKRDGGAAAATTVNSGATFFLEPLTHYQGIIRIDLADATPHVIFCTRSGVTGPWREKRVNGGTAGVHEWYSTVDTRLLKATDASTTPFEGKVVFVGAALLDISIADMQSLMDYPTPAKAQEVIGTTHGRFWAFQAGTGAYCHELVRDEWKAIAGTVVWETGLSGCTQTCLRQGGGATGKAGVRIGGETGYAASGGGGITAAHATQILSGQEWSFQATLRVGERQSASEQILVFAKGPLTTGADAAIGKYPGAGFTFTNTESINGAVKQQSLSDASNTIGGAVGEGADYAANGALATYTLVCKWDGTQYSVKGYRQKRGETAPTLVTGAAAWLTADYDVLRANAIQIGNPAFDLDLVTGYIAGYGKALSLAEMAQNHRNAIARMAGETIYLDSNAPVAGNGTQNAPYTTMRAVIRTLQINQRVEIAGGDYEPINIYLTAERPPESTGIVFNTDGTVTVDGLAAGTLQSLPLYLDSGSWRLGGTGRYDFVADGANNTAAGKVLEGVASFILENGSFSGAISSGGGTGAGLNMQADYFEFGDVQSFGNAEHGIYARIQAGDSDKTFRIGKLYCYDNDEDGLKFSSEGGEGAAWTGTADQIRVDGGQNQVWISGVKDSVFTNMILENQASAGTTGALYLGYAGGTDGEDTSVNNVIANVTIYNAVTAVLDQQSTGTTIQNLVAVDCTNDFVQGELGTAVVTHSAGIGTNNPLPTDPTNIPESLDLALVDPANVTPASRDFHLDEGVDGEGDGINLTGIVPQAETDYAGDARPSTGVWNMGAY